MVDSSLSDDDPSSSSDEEIHHDIPEVGGNEKRRTSVLDVNVSDPVNFSLHASGSQPLAIEPRCHDVLLGRGRPYQNFSGNKQMLKIVSRYKDEYSARPRDQKRAFVEIVLDIVLKDGTKFLRRLEASDGSSHWEEVDRSAAAEKVWHALRCKDRPGRQSKKRKASGHEAGSSPPVGADGGTQPAGQTIQNPATAGNNTTLGGNLSDTAALHLHHLSIDALLGDIQLHLNHAVAGTNRLASIILTGSRTAQSNGNFGNVFAAPAPPTVGPAGGNLMQQPVGTAAAGLRGHEWLHNPGISLPPMNAQQGSQHLPPLSYAHLAGLAPSPYGNQLQQGRMESSMMASSSVPTAQRFSQPPQSTGDRNDILAQAVNILMQASQQRQQGSH